MHVMPHLGDFINYRNERDQDVIDQFCILMDWEITPKDIQECFLTDRGYFFIQTKDGEEFKVEKDPDSDAVYIID